MHPTFKPVFVASNRQDIYSHSHMKTPRVSKMIPAKDSWHPCFDEVREGNDRNGEFVSGKVEVNLFPSYKGVSYKNEFHVELWTWRISIWGNDDTYAEKDFDSYTDAKATFDALDVCPKLYTIYSVWGFTG